jgi:hypothetical protein|tara:strand:+ start:176 stop:628 length:453 start_codon:yes stop_codon:yes gene_type:complete
MEEDMTDKKSTIWQEELRKHLDNATPTEDWNKLVEQDDRIIQFDAGEEVRATKEEVLKATELLEGNMGEGKAEVVKAFAKAEGIPIHSIDLPDLDEESKRSDRFFGMRLKGKSIDDIENTFLAMFAEFIVLMALFIGMLGFGVLLWAIFG